MSLASGSRVGVYEIGAPLGAGGMGEVYRARDTRLDRQVAIKVLLPSVAGDPDRLARFEREAKVLAALNHPHIAQIYGLEGTGQTRALVMELVEGPTLADRLTAGPLPIDEAVSIGRQIAQALEAAHDQSIIHRDLKPANVKIRPDGTVKVLDFGLAKLADTSAGSSGASALTSPGMTQAGVVLGTPAYMSPEQARGHAVDARADLWGLGCVCYEMLVGRRAFDGETATDAIAAVLTREPAWSDLPADTPEALRRLLRRCLTRDVTRRLRHAGDARLELEDIAAGSTAGAAPPAPIAPRRAQLSWTIAAAATGLALWLGWNLWTAPGSVATADAQTIRLELSLPAGLELFPSTASTIFVSPDGQTIAFVGTSGGSRQLFLRRLDGFETSAVRGTTGATTAAFSPDSASLVFVTAGGELKTVSLASGLVATATKDASLLYGVTWAANDDLVFSRAGTLWTVTRTGVGPRQLTTLGADEQAHGWPSALPGGGAVLFTVEGPRGSSIEAVTLATGERRPVLKQAARAKVGPEDRLFFYRDDRMLATAFDASALTAIGDPIPVVENVQHLGAGAPVGDVSPNGLMVFPLDAPQRQLVWVSRQGVETPVGDMPRSYLNPRLSPDDTRIVFQAGGIWVHDLRRQAVERVPTQSSAANAFPLWLPDGVTVMHRSGVGLRLQNTESAAEGRTLGTTTEFDYPGGVTADGSTLVFARSSPDTSFDILVAPMSNPSQVKALVKTAAYEGGGRLSPDGRWLVYVSNQSGRNEVYVRAFQDPERRRQISTDGGSQPAWNPNGREVFYRIADRLMAVDVAIAGDALQPATPRQLFARAYSYGAGITMANYDVTRDGQRFIMVRDDAAAGRLRVILNWRADAHK